MISHVFAEQTLLNKVIHMVVNVVSSELRSDMTKRKPESAAAWKGEAGLPITVAQPVLLYFPPLFLPI